jgi:hypothetical protein
MSAPILMRATLLSLRGNALAQAENRRMSDSALVFAVLLIGGLAFLAIFFSIIVTSVRESKANEPPSEISHQH